MVEVFRVVLLLAEDSLLTLNLVHSDTYCKLLFHISYCERVPEYDYPLKLNSRESRENKRCIKKIYDGDPTFWASRIVFPFQYVLLFIFCYVRYQAPEFKKKL